MASSTPVTTTVCALLQFPEVKVNDAWSTIAQVTHFDKADIKITFMLDEAVEILKANPEVKVEVQGHTDNVGDAGYNLDLSQRRAQSVAGVLISQGVPSGRVQIRLMRLR